MTERPNIPLSEMRESNEPLSAQIYNSGMEWADALAAAQLLEEGKSAYLSQRMSQSDAKSINAKEMEVKASEEWADYIKKMVRARQTANRLQVKREFLKAKMSEWIANDANHRLVSKA